MGYIGLTREEHSDFLQGNFQQAYRCFGAHKDKVEGEAGYRFTLWAPGVASVAVVGSFSDWDPKRNEMLPTEYPGIWQLFIPGVQEGDLYKYLLTTREGEAIYKADPYAFYAQKPPETASRIADLEDFFWKDGRWLAKRRRLGHSNRPLNIYEVHLGSWKRTETGDYYTYKELAETLVPYAAEMGYTHLEFMPVMEHPFDGSWGYQTTGYYAPTSRYGTPKDFMALIDSCHRANLGVILDWVPGHFCKDAHGLANFTGEKLYEDCDHAQWGTANFDYKRGEVCSFLLSNAMYWLEYYHVDGIRVDGVTSMLYLNFGLEDADKKRFNHIGTEENLDASRFLRNLNGRVGVSYPETMMIAEESTAWPLVTYPPEVGGLGFHYKWDMGWMHDTLNYIATDFPFRPGNHRLLTFSMMYAFQENFILSFSHDEVVHGKCSLIGRMPGDYWRQFAGMRILALYQMCHSGGKQNFMGNEIAQFIEWRYYEGIEWFLLDYDSHKKHQQFIKSLNKLYREQHALWEKDHSWEGFTWLEADDNRQSTISFLRHGKKPGDDLVVLLNFVPEVQESFRIGVPRKGVYREIFSSDETVFGGSGRTNAEDLISEPVAWHGMEHSIVVRTPPIGGAVFRRVAQRTAAVGKRAAAPQKKGETPQKRQKKKST